MAHFAGLVAAGLHPSPVPHADVVTTTVHKTLGGARGGMILCRRSTPRRSTPPSSPGSRAGRSSTSSPARPSRSGSPQTEVFRERQQRTLDGANAVVDALLGAGHGVNVLTGGTDVHLALVDLRESEIDGQQSEDRLHDIGITVNRNAVPFDPRPPMVTSGLRVGTSALATRGLQADDFAEVGDIMATALTPDFEARRGELAERVSAIADRYPLYEHLCARTPRSDRAALPPGVATRLRGEWTSAMRFSASRRRSCSPRC